MRRAPAILAGAGAVALAASAVAAPAAAARGWLIAFLYCSGPLIGAVVLRLIGRLTGGTWPQAPGLERQAAAAPWLPALGAPVLALAGLIYPWAHAGAPAQLRAYLSWGPFAARGLVVLGGWSLIAALPPRLSGKPFAAGALAFYGLSIGFAAVDFSLSTLPGWMTSAAGMALAVHQLTGALAVALLTGTADARQERDLSGLLVATLLADAYFALMTYLVAWYGDQAPQTLWYRLRADPGWSALLTAALMLGDGAPLLLLAVGRRRLGAGAARGAGALALIGLALQALWSGLPQLGMAALVPAVAASALVAGLWLGALPRWRPGRPAHAA